VQKNWNFSDVCNTEDAISCHSIAAVENWLSALYSTVYSAYNNTTYAVLHEYFINTALYNRLQKLNKHRNGYNYTWMMYVLRPNCVRVLLPQLRALRQLYIGIRLTACIKGAYTYMYLYLLISCEVTLAAAAQPLVQQSGAFSSI